MIKSLLDRCDTSWILAADHIFDLLRKSQRFLGDDLSVFNNIYSNVVIDESEDIEIHEIDRAFDLHDIFFAHFITFCIFDDGNTAV